jgi:hypothetical protein
MVRLSRESSRFLPMSADGEQSEWLREKRALEERIRQLEALQQPHPPQPPPPLALARADVSLDKARVPTVDEVNAMVARLSNLVPERSDNGNALFLRHLGTIISNLLRTPYNQPKYRRLKFANPTLAAELFSHPSTRAVLSEVVGFQQRTDEVDGSAILVLPDSNAAHITLLRTIQAALPRLQQRDDIAAEAASRFAQFRKAVAFELRMERLAEAMHREDDDAQHSGDGVGAQDEDDAAVASSSSHNSTTHPIASDTADNDDIRYTNVATTVRPPVRDFVAAALAWNDADLGTKVVGLLRTIGRNIKSDPSNERFKALRLSSGAVRDTIFPANGSVEYLLAVLGFHWSTDGLALQLNPNDASSVEAFHNRLAAGEALLDDVAAALESKREAEREMQRRAALEEREAEKRRQDAEKRACQAAPATPQPVADVEDDADARPQRERIPIAEALKRLMGKDRGDDW